MDNILIGKFMGDASLGLYDRAYKLMLYPVQNLTHVITPVLHPILSEYQDDKDVIYNSYKKVVKILGLIGIPISIFSFFSAAEIINVLYGAGWEKSIPVFKILACTIFIQMMLSSTGSIFQASGKTNKLFLSGTLSAILMVSGILFGVYIGKIEYVGIGILVAFYLNFFQGFYILIHSVLQKSLFRFLVELKNLIIIGIIMMIPYLFITIDINNPLLSLVIKFIIGLISYIIGLIITKEYKFLKSLK
jgi:PST family polysaccharide transporter